MTETEAEHHVAAAAAALGLTIDSAWKANVLAFFRIAEGMAKLVADAGSVAENEAAPVFTPKDIR